MQIERVQMTRPHYERGAAGRVRMIVLHATAGRGPTDLAWLRAGGDERRPVSVHYYISKAGRIVQLVDEDDIAWHAGQSRWQVDGRQVNGCNSVSVGIELENLNSGRDPYPAAQYAAALWLCRELAARHAVPRGQLVRHLDIAPGRKTDPAGFPWERFVAEVYADAPGLPAPSQQLRAGLLDLAFRSAGGALAADWPFFAVAQANRLGMPVATPSGRPAGGAGAAQDDHDRAVRLAGQGALLVEIYARDLLYAPVDSPAGQPPRAEQVRRLSETPAGPLHSGLVELLFRSADPVNGFRPDWAFHQHYVEHSAELGVPIGPNQRLRHGGQDYVCQHFALDSLCSPSGRWRTVYRLRDLAEAAAGAGRLTELSAAEATALRHMLLESLYRERAGRSFDERASLVRYAIDKELGAPLGPAEQIELDDAQLLIMPFAMDVLYCRLPAADWPYDRPLPVGGLSGTLGAASPGAAVGRLADLTRAAGSGALPPIAAAGFLLGAEESRPAFHDLRGAWAGGRRGAGQGPELLLLCAAPGPAAADLASEGAADRWHYYIERDGAITHLRDEGAPSRVAQQIGRRAVVLACEGGLPGAESGQGAALAWLVRSLIVQLGLNTRCLRVLNRAALFAWQPPEAIAEGATT